MSSPDPSSDDLRHLERALELGRMGWAGAHPNPMVGCVVVNDGVVVGEGYHEVWGGPHAEVNALMAAGERARGATVYVSLEPCDHHGRTPPCTRALLDARVARVVFGASDPGELSGGGGRSLEEAGVAVSGPLLPQSRARELNPAFFFNADHGAPYLALKLAQTLDGRIAAAPGERTTITGPEAQAETHRLRSGFDAIMVGSGTALVDDPRLTARTPAATRPAVRIVLDSAARLSPEAALFREEEGGPVFIFTAQDAPGGSVIALEKAGARVHRVERGEGGLSLDNVLRVCWDQGIRSIFCEGGGRLASALLRGNRVQRLYLFVAPFVLGERGVPAFPGAEGEGFWRGFRPAAEPALFGRDVLLTFDGSL